MEIVLEKHASKEVLSFLKTFLFWSLVPNYNVRKFSEIIC